MDSNSEGYDSKVQKYSSGLNIIIRLDSLWRDTHKHSRDGNYSKWNSDLDRIWLELARDIDKKEEEIEEGEAKSEFSKKEKDFKAFIDNLKKVMPFLDDGLQGFKKPSIKQIGNRQKQYNILMDKQVFLARLENDLGKGTSYEEEDEDF